MALINAEVIHEGDGVVGEGVEGEGLGVEVHGVAVTGHIRSDKVSVFEMREARSRLDFSGTEAVEEDEGL